MGLNNVSIHRMYSHESSLIELYGTVNANGSVNSGCVGVTIQKTGTGVYNILINDLVPINPLDFDNTNQPSNLSMAPEANGTQVTKTFICLADPFSTTALSASSSIPVAVPSKGSSSSIGVASFTVLTGLSPSTGGAAVAADVPFNFKIVSSTLRSQRT